MFVDEQEVIKIKVFYKKAKTNYFCINEEKFRELALKLKNEKTRPSEKEAIAKYLRGLKELNVEMRPFTWGMQNKLLEDCLTENPNTGEKYYSQKKNKELKLRMALIRWDATDVEGNPIKLDVKNLEKLSPAIAETILSSYDDVSFLDDDPEGNSLGEYT